MSGLEALSAERIDRQVRNDLGLAVGVNDGVGEVEPRGNTVLTLADNTNRGPLASGAVNPVTNMVDESGGGRGGRRSTAGGDDSGTTLLNLRDEGLDNPVVVVDDLRGGAALDGSVGEGGVHGWAVVTPDCEAGHLGNVGASLDGELSEGAVVVKAGHGREVLSRDRGSVALGDHGVGVRGVADNGDLDALLGALVQSLTLNGEDLSVTKEEITALHSLGAGLGTDEEGSVNIDEGLNGIVVGGNTAKQGEGTILKLHDNSLERGLSGGEVQQVDVDGSGITEHGTRSDAEEQSVANVSSGASDGNLNGGGTSGVLGDDTVGNVGETLHALTQRGGVLVERLNERKNENTLDNELAAT